MMATRNMNSYLDLCRDVMTVLLILGDKPFETAERMIYSKICPTLSQKAK